MSVAVARGEIHRGVCAVRVLRQSLLNSALRLYKTTPVHGGQKSQATNGVANGYLIGSLLLVARLHQLLDRAARFREMLFHPVERQGQRRTVPLQATRKFRDERRRHGWMGTCHIGDDQHQILGVGFDDFKHLIRPRTRQITFNPSHRYADRDAAQILD